MKKPTNQNRCVQAWFLMFSVTIAFHIHADNLMIHDAWSRAMPEQAVNGAIYMTIENQSATDDHLIQVSTDMAKVSELHTTSQQNDMMEMKKIESGVDIPAREVRKLQPGGDHIMLMGLVKPLRAGETFSLTLIFQNAGEKKVKVVVRESQE